VVGFALKIVSSSIRIAARISVHQLIDDRFICNQKIVEAQLTIKTKNMPKILIIEDEAAI
jgi:hypothetical protein